jgi:tape measure domain-containing protein
MADGFRSVVDKTDEMCDRVTEKLESISNVGQRLAIFGASLTAGITVPLEEIARQSLDVAGTFEQTSIAFTTLLGSAAESRTMLANLYQFAATTPFEIPQVLQGARQLMAFGFSSKDVIPILTAVGNQAAALGTGGEGMQRILMNLGKIQAEGKLTGHELRNLGEDGVAAVDMLAQALNKSPQEISKMVSKGEIDPDTAINALVNGMQARSGGLMMSQMDSFRGQLSNLKDQITLTAAAIGETLLPVGKVMVNWAQELIGYVKDLTQGFADLPGPIQASAIGLAGLAAMAGPAIGAIGALGYSLPHLAAGFTAVKQIWAYVGTLGGTLMGFAGDIGTTVWMIGSLISEEGLLAGASYALEVGIGALGSVFLSVPALIVGVTAALAALATWVYSHWDGVKAAVGTVWDGLGDLWNATLGPAINSVKSMFQELWSLVPSGFGNMWNSLKSGFSEFKSWLDQKNDEIYESTKKWAEQFPGVKKMESAGDTFRRVDHDSSERKEMADISSRLGVGKDAKPFSVASAYQAELEKHNAKLKEAIELLAKFKKGYEDGIVSLKDFKQAEENVQSLRDEKIIDPRKKSEVSLGKIKLDRAAMNDLTGAHAHDEAALAFRKAAIEHEYQMAQPGSADRKDTAAETLAEEQIKAAEERKRQLDQIALEELQKTRANLEEKLKVAGLDKAGHEAIIEAKQKAEDKFLQTVQKNAFDLETVKKQANDRIAQAEQKADDEAEKREQKRYEMSLRTTDLRVAAQEKQLQLDIKQQEFEASQADKRLQYELETGTLSKDQYLRLKQEQYDAAYQMEMDAIAKERQELEDEFAGLRAMALGQLAAATTDAQRQAASDRLIQIDADHDKRMAPLKERQQSVENKESERKLDTDLGIKKNQFNSVWAPVQNGFSSAIADMIKGTKTFQQAFQGMAVTVLGSWINSISQMASKWLTHLAQMGAQWVAHKAMELVVHTATNQGKVASDAAAAAESNSISLFSHLKQIMMAAKLAAAKAWSAVVGIPVVGPVLAPVAAAATFAGVMAFGAISAERGGVLPNENTFGFLHPQEMVLPKGISVGLQNLIASGGLSNASSIMNQSQGGALSSGALQMIRNTAQADRGTTNQTHNWGGITLHNSAKEPLTADKVFNLMQQAVRGRNLKMA